MPAAVRNYPFVKNLRLSAEGEPAGSLVAPGRGNGRGLFLVVNCFGRGDVEVTGARNAKRRIALGVLRTGAPEKCPDPVRAEVVAALSLFRIDLAARLNRIRNALELVLNDLRVPNSMMSNKNKKVRLSLHQRIERLKAKRPKLPDICERMMAVKHLVNAGSHPGVKVKQDDVFDCFDILERVLQHMYSDHSGELARAVRQINKRKGPRKKNGD